MKRIIIATIALALTICADAQQWEQTTPDASVYIIIDSGDLTALPLHIGYMNSTDESMCGLECTLELPEGVTVLRNSSGGEALNSLHIYMKNIFKQSQQDNTNTWLFTCYSRAADVDAKKFRCEGEVATLYLDVSALSEGQYNITMRNAILVWTDGYTVTQFKTADTGYVLKLMSDHAQGGVATDIQGIVEEDTKQVSPAQRGIYTLQGVKVDRTEPGRIYIVNGRKVLMK